MNEYEQYDLLTSQMSICEMLVTYYSNELSDFRRLAPSRQEQMPGVISELTTKQEDAQRKYNGLLTKRIRLAKEIFETL